ncbi:MAG TPA: VWA domain-containing protein [Vicinamibacterales bacterium]|jgi:Ca-activated chloride channel family protein|nr:VWA domain-containing protein [Vicinamibacterales bacterium]
MRFLSVELGSWFFAALAAVAALRWRVHRWFAASSSVRWLAPRMYRASLVRRLPLGFLAAGLALVGLALMDPVLPYTDAQVESRGLDIVILLDLSSSMQEPMERVPAPTRTRQNPTRSEGDAASGPTAGKTRLDATKEAIKTFVRHRRDDRIALIVFSDNAYVVSPLTFDYDYLLRYIDLVDDQMLRGEGMTAIGDGLALSNYLLDRQSRSAEQRNRVIVLFTDGENTKGRDPIEVMKETNDAHVRVHVIGVDLESEIAKPPVQKLLATVRKYGGRYFNANTERDLDAASRSIDSIEKGSIVSHVRVRDVPVYQWFSLPALVCFALALALRAVPFFVDQT